MLPWHSWPCQMLRPTIIGWKATHLDITACGPPILEPGCWSGLPALSYDCWITSTIQCESLVFYTGCPSELGFLVCHPVGTCPFDVDWLHIPPWKGAVQWTGLYGTQTRPLSGMQDLCTSAFPGRKQQHYLCTERALSISTLFADSMASMNATLRESHFTSTASVDSNGSWCKGWQHPLQIPWPSVIWMDGCCGPCKR